MPDDQIDQFRAQVTRGIAATEQAIAAEVERHRARMEGLEASLAGQREQLAELERLYPTR